MTARGQKWANDECDHLTFFKWFHRILFICSKHPSFQSLNPLSKPDMFFKNQASYLSVLERNELKDLTTEWHPSFSVALVCYNLLFVVRNFYYAWWSITLFQNRRPQTSQEDLADGLTQTRLACIQTNCSSLSFGEPDWNSADLIATQMMKLPLFRICNPKLSSFYSPAIFSGKSLLFLTTAHAILIGLMCIIYPTLNSAWKSHNESVMFIRAPTLTRRLNFVRMSRLVQDLSNSWKYNCWSSCRQISSKGYSFQYSLTDYGISSRFNQKTLFTCQAKLASLQTTIRSSWWRRRIVRAYYYLTTFLIVFSSIGWLISYMIIDHFNSATSNHLKRLQNYINTQNCSVVVFEPDEKPLNFNNINMEWNFTSILETLIYVIPPTATFITAIPFYYLTVYELEHRLLELKHSTLLLIELTSMLELSHTSLIDTKTSPQLSLETQTNFIDLICEDFMTKIDSSCILDIRNTAEKSWPGYRNSEARPSFGSKIDIKISSQIFALESLKLCSLDIGKPDYGGDLAILVCSRMEHLYLSYRLFSEAVRQASKSLSVSTSMGHMVIYGIILWGVYYIRLVENASELLVVYMFTSLCFLTIFTYLLASFHSNVSS